MLAIANYSNILPKTGMEPNNFLNEGFFFFLGYCFFFVFVFLYYIA